MAEILFVANSEKYRSRSDSAERWNRCSFLRTFEKKLLVREVCSVSMPKWKKYKYSRSKLCLLSNCRFFWPEFLSNFGHLLHILDKMDTTEKMEVVHWLLDHLDTFSFFRVDAGESGVHFGLGGLVVSFDNMNEDIVLIQRVVFF